MSVLVAERIGKRFGERRVLASAWLGADAGEVTLVLGRNGAGKSTLLRICAGQVAPDHGTVRFGGRVYERPRLARLARGGLFFLPDRDLLSGSFSFGAQLAMVQRRYGGAPRQAADRLGVGHLLARSPATFSGGERRRAEVAAALLRRPKCLLADEPFRGVAPIDAEALAAAFRTMADGGTAVVVTGHDLGTLLPLADRVIWVASGTSYDLGSPARAGEHEAFSREYLGRAHLAAG